MRQRLMLIRLNWLGKNLKNKKIIIRFIIQGYNKKMKNIQKQLKN